MKFLGQYISDKKHFRDRFLEVSISFKTLLKNMARSLFQVPLQTVYRKPATWWKEDSSKFLEELLLGTYDAFLDRAAKHRSFCYFTKKWFHHRRFHINFHNSWNKQTKEAFAVESIFGIVIGG